MPAMTTGSTLTANTNALGALLSAKCQIDHMLARIQTLSDNYIDTETCLPSEIADLQTNDGDVVLGADAKGHNDLKPRNAAFLPNKTSRRNPS